MLKNIYKKRFCVRKEVYIDTPDKEQLINQVEQVLRYWKERKQNYAQRNKNRQSYHQ